MVYIGQTTRTYWLEVDGFLFQDWYWDWDSDCWRKLTKEMRQSEWWQDYESPTTTTEQILVNLTGQFQGVRQWDSYGDFSVTVDVDELEVTEDEFIAILRTMARWVRRRKKLEAYEAPYRDASTDGYGNPTSYWRAPAILPVPGSPELEYPKDLELDSNGFRYT